MKLSNSKHKDVTTANSKSSVNKNVYSIDNKEKTFSRVNSFPQSVNRGLNTIHSQSITVSLLKSQTDK